MVLIAFHQNDFVIQPKHITEALQSTYQKINQPESKIKKWANAWGGILLGVFVPVFIEGLSTRDDVKTFIFIVVGITDLALLNYSFD